LDSEVGREFEKKRIQFTQIQRYVEGPHSWANLRSETWDLGPWIVAETRQKRFVAFSRPYGGPTRRSLIRGLISPSKRFFCL